MTSDDVDAVARAHRRHLPHGLFPMLGVGFLRCYYQSFVASPHAVALIAPADGGPTAHLVGTVDHQRHHRWTLRRRGLRLAMHGLFGLIRHPEAMRLFLRTRVLRYLRALARALTPTRAAPLSPDGGPSAAVATAVLTHVVVAPTARGSGLGRGLVGDFVRHAHEAGCRDLCLVTRATDGAGAFYESQGWHRVGDHRRHGHRVIEYRHGTPGSSNP